jgi:GPN-loop GTPase
MSDKGKQREGVDSNVSIEPDSSTSKKGVSIICIGMAGSGKTTMIQRLNAYLHSQGKPPYIINLDPAVAKLPYEEYVSIDIRTPVDYKEVMKQ